MEEITYKDDFQVDGPYVKYHQNGQVSAEGLIKGGKYEGLSLAYYEGGLIWIKRIHKGRSTDVTEYFPDGKIAIIETWKDRKIRQRKGFYIKKCKKRCKSRRNRSVFRKLNSVLERKDVCY